MTRGAAVRRRWTGGVLVACGSLGVLTALPVHAQDRGTIIGVAGGWASTTQRWKPPESTEDYGGFILGAFADAATPTSWIAVRGELTYTQRGGDVMLDVDGQPAPASVRMGYLSIVAHAKLQRTLGPVRVHLAFGPTLDQVLRRRLDSLLSQIFEEETPTVFGIAVGAGLGTWVSGRLHVAVDVRLTEGLSPAHEGSFTSVRNRSLEGLLSVGFPLALIRDR